MKAWQAAGLGWIAGIVVATGACLAAIALETHAQKDRSHG